ncbi:MAG: Na+/H+ antiporter NhaA [Gammaproteobacteria bacterium]
MGNRGLFAALRSFFLLEPAAGIILLGAAVLAIALANSPLAHYYSLLINVPVEIRAGTFEIAKPVLLWINDGLMAIFFFQIGLELKREVREGELSSLRNVALPAIGAVGGMAVPALFYVLINTGNATALQGWAIPAATDIAFALGILSLFGRRVPTGLKIFLVSIAIFDDIGAILIIAFFYTHDLSLVALAVAGGCLIVLYILNRRGIVSVVPYLLVGLVMWVAVLKSGVHATLAGVLLALFIPLRDRNNPERSPLLKLEHDLGPSVSFVILPLFAFANAGVPLGALGAAQLLHPVTLGIAAGLFLGKQLGVFSFCWLGIKLRIAKLPPGTNWAAFYGAALLCGVGFTMSLFIAALAFEEGAGAYEGLDRLGILIGSFASGIVGYLVLRFALRNRTGGAGLTPSPIQSHSET